MHVLCWSLFCRNHRAFTDCLGTCLQTFLEFTSSGKFHRHRRKACAGDTALASPRETKGLESTAGLSSLSKSSRSCRPKQQPRSQADVSDKVCITRGGGVTPGGGRKEALFPGKPIFRLRLEGLRRHLHNAGGGRLGHAARLPPPDSWRGSWVPCRRTGRSGAAPPRCQSGVRLQRSARLL